LADVFTLFLVSFPHQVQVNMDALLDFDALTLPDQISKKVLSRKSESLGMTFGVNINFDIAYKVPKTNCVAEL